MPTLKGKQIVLGVCGGIAAYKAVELLRLLTKAGAIVSVVMTRNACEFVTPLTFQTLSYNPVHTDMFDLYQEKEIGHISLADKADLCVVVPATANIIGKVTLINILDLICIPQTLGQINYHIQGSNLGREFNAEIRQYEPIIIVANGWIPYDFSDTHANYPKKVAG